MRRKYRFTTLIWLIGVFPVGSATQAQESRVEGDEILETLVAYDRAFLSSLDLSLEATFPTTPFDVTQGNSTALVRIAGDGTQIAMDCQQTKMDAPRFADDRVGPDYEENGDYVLNYTKNLFVRLGPDSSKSRIDQERTSVSRTNAVSKSASASPYFEVHSAGNLDSKNRVYRYLLPLGRGFSELLDEVIGEEILEDGTVRITATGSLFSPNMGEWVLDIDPSADHLVRSATFTREGSDDSSTVVCEATENPAGDSPLPLWTGGTFQLASNYDISVRLARSSGKPDEVFLGEVESAVNTIRENSTLLDFSAPDREGKPLVIRGVAAPE